MADAASKKRKIAVDSDSDDDVPLSELKNRIAVKKENEESNSKKPKGLISKSSTPSSTAVAVKTEKKTPAPVAADDSDSDDDVPIAVLMKRKMEAQAKAAAKASPARKATPIAKPTASKTKAVKIEPKKKVVAVKKSSTSSSGGAKKIQGNPLESSELTEKFYRELDKGKLCQQLLRRWWYALSWPEEGVTKLCPKGYEPLHGFPGVFVGTATNYIGNIVDKRDKDTCPCLRNFSQKSSAELKDLCIVAYEEQIKQLIEAEGPNTKLERTLKRELQEIKHIEPEKADKQAEKLLKQPF